MMSQGPVHNIAIFVLGSFFNEAWSLMQNLSLEQLGRHEIESKNFAYAMTYLPVDETCTLYFFNPPQSRRFDFLDLAEIRTKLNISSVGFIVMLDLSKPETFKEVHSLWQITNHYFGESVVALADRRSGFSKAKQDQHVQEMYQHVLGDRWSTQIYPCDVKQQRYKALEVVSHLLDLMPDQPNIEAIQKKIRTEIEAGKQERTVQILLIEPFYPSEAGIKIEDNEQPFPLPERIEIEAGCVIEFHKVPKDKWRSFEWMEAFHLQHPNSLMGCIMLLNPLLSMTSPKVTEIIRHFEHFSPYPCVFMGYLEDDYSFNRQVERMTRLSQRSDEVVLIGDIRKPEEAKRAVKRLMDGFPHDELASYIKARLG